MASPFPGRVLALFGPTASGKSDVAEAVARRIPAEVVSADSMQVYRGLPILTNQSPAHLVAIWPLDHEASVGEFGRLAHEAIDAVLARERTPLVVGGTGLYLRAALGELDLPPAVPPEERRRWERLYDRLGGERTHELLMQRDPAAAVRVHPNDRRRVVRALELAERGHSLAGARLWQETWRRPTLIFGLDVPKDELERRIVARTHRMFERGVEAEVRAALARPISETARHVHGLHEVAALPRAEAIDALVVRTRRYAAYQRKWMRRIPGLVMVSASQPADEVADEILQVARARQQLSAGRAS